MMRVAAVVGGKNSGKTTIIQHLARELRDRGYRVGSVKEMPNAGWIDTPSKETWRYGEAGAEIVVGAAINEIAIFVKRRLPLREIASLLAGIDYLFLEGFENERTVVKVIAAKDVAEVQRFYDDLTIAVSGIIAESKEEVEKASAFGIPILNCKMETKELADIVERKALPLFPNFSRCGECGYSSCHELAKAIITETSSLKECPLLEKEDIVLEVNRKIVPLKAFPRLFIKRTLMGMISSLNGIGQVEEIKVTIKKP
ncbi:MAG: molybdopterin-guanine dinucleotide biosynthesis protein B [Candidatus Bathyarchaeia archaeon]